MLVTVVGVGLCCMSDVAGSSSVVSLTVVDERVRLPASGIGSLEARMSAVRFLLTRAVLLLPLVATGGIPEGVAVFFGTVESSNGCWGVFVYVDFGEMLFLVRKWGCLKKYINQPKSSRVAR